MQNIGPQKTLLSVYRTDTGCFADMFAETIYQRFRFADTTRVMGCKDFGVLVMKRKMCALLFLLVLLWHCNPASAARGRPKSKSGSSSARTGRTRDKNTAARSDRHTRLRKAKPEKTSTRQKAAKVEKPHTAKAHTSRETTEKAKDQKRQSPEDSATSEVKEQKEKPGGQGKKDRLAQAESEQEEKPGKGKGKQEVKSQKKIQKAATENTEEKDKAKGRYHKQQQTALQKQLQHEEQKHLKRAVRLERMRALAQKQGDGKKVERIEKLMARERQRYGRKRRRMLGREGKVEEKAEGSRTEHPE
jgi:hypothetical protein